jgi:hypothetical protein
MHASEMFTSCLEHFTVFAALRYIAMSFRQHAVAAAAYSTAIDSLLSCMHYDAGVDRESAYKLAEKEMAVEAEDKLKLNRKMIDSARAVAGTGATPAFLADPAVYKVSCY